MIPWVVTSADRDGKPRRREWRNPLGMDYIGVIDDPSERSHIKSGGRYGIYTVTNNARSYYGTTMRAVDAPPVALFTGMAFATIPALTAHLQELKALNRTNDVYEKIARLAPPDLLGFMERNRDQVIAAIEAAFAAAGARGTTPVSSAPLTSRAERVRARLQLDAVPAPAPPPTKPAIDVLGMARDVWNASKEREDRALLLELLQVARLAADLDEDTKEKALTYLTIAATRLAELVKPPQDSDVPTINTSDVEDVDYADLDKIDETSDRFAHAARSRGYVHRLMSWQALSLTPAELAHLIPYARGLWKAQLRSARESLLGVQRWIRKDHLFRADNSAKNVTIGTRVRATAQYAKGGTTQGPTQAGYGVAISAGNQDAKDAIGTTAAMLVQFDPPQPPRRITPAFDILDAKLADHASEE